MTTVRLGDLAQINPSAPLAAGDDMVSFVGLAELDAATARAVPLESRPFRDVSTGYTIFKNGDILAAKITPSWENGKVGVADLAQAVGVGSTEFHVVRPGSSLDVRFALHLLRQPAVRLRGAMRMTGSAGQRRVPAAFLRDLQFSLPALEEQRRIAAILDAADAIRRLRRILLTEIDDLAQSLFRHQFGDTAAVGARVNFEEMTTLITKGTTPTSVGLRYTDRGVPFLRAQNIQDGGVYFGEGDLYIDEASHDALRRSKVLAGDVLISIAGTIGRVGIVPPESPEMNCNQAIAIARLRDPESGPWLRAWLGSPDAQRQISGSAVTATISNLSLGQIRRLSVPVISGEELRAFTFQVDAIEAARARVELALAADEQLFASLQARAFSGRL